MVGVAQYVNSSNCCSTSWKSSLSAGRKGSELDEADHLEPATWIPANENKREHSNLICYALQMLGRKGEAMMRRFEDQNARQLHKAGNFRSLGIPDVDNSVIVRAKKPVLPAPVVAPNVGSNYYWEQLLISHRRLLMRRSQGPSEPEAL